MAIAVPSCSLTLLEYNILSSCSVSTVSSGEGVPLVAVTNLKSVTIGTECAFLDSGRKFW